MDRSVIERCSREKRRLPWMEIGEITLWQMIKIIRYQVSIAYLII